MRRLRWLLIAWLCFSVSVRAQFTIPNHPVQGQTSVYNQNQTLWMQADVDALVAGIGGRGVLAGGAVTWSSGLTLAVAGGSLQIGGVSVPMPPGSVTLAQSSGGRHRLDLIVGSGSGPIVISGDFHLTPVAPTLPATSVLLAIVFVPAGSISLSAARILDKRVFVSTSTGSSSGSTALNVQSYGAVGNSSTDDTAAIQAAVDAAIATNESRTVFFPTPSGYYKVTAPILVHGATLPNLTGESGIGFSVGTEIRASGFDGPTFHLASATPQTDVAYSTSLATGAGASLQRSASSTATYLDLADLTSAQLNGLSQLSVELFIKVTAFTGDFRQHVLESTGSLTNASTTTAFKIQIDTTGHLIGCINVAGTCTEMTAVSALSLNTVYQVELSYNGSAVKMFYGTPGNTSVQAGSTVNTSGTVSQSKYETMAVGGTRQNWPHGDYLQEPITGLMDSIRLSDVARHTGTYTAPSTKFASDASTLVLENFDNETSFFSKVSTSAGTGYLNKYGSGANQTRGGEVSHLEITSIGSGFLLNGVIQGSFHDLTIRQGVYGIHSINDTFIDRFEKIWFVTQSTQSRAALALISQNDINSYRSLDFEAWPTSIVMRSGSGEIATCYFHGTPATIPIVIREGTWDLIALSVSNEDASASNFVADLFLGNVYSVTITGGTWERYVSAGPAIVTATGKSITVMGGRFMMHSGATEVVQVNSAPSQPIVLLNPMKDQAGVPWSTDIVNVVTLP